MRNYIIILSAIIFAGCSNGELKSEEDVKIDVLTTGRWSAVDFEGEVNKFQRGIVFSKDKQFFNLDSQGRIIPKQREKVFDLKNDTLRIVDFNYEPKFIHKKGTQIFIVSELNEEKLVLKSIYPDSKNIYKFKNEEL
jgi:hypothetical protein